MGRRRSDVVPKPVVDARSGHERIRVCGRVVWLGAAGSDVARARYAAVRDAWIASNGTSIEAGLASPAFGRKPEPVALEPKAPPPVPGCDLTVGGLCLAYLASIKGSLTAEQLAKKSRWWRAREVANALYSRRAVLVNGFGPRMLREVRDELASTPKLAKRNGKTQLRARQHVNRLIRETTAMFAWGVSEEMLPVSILQALKTTPPLKPGDSPAREGAPRGHVPLEVVDATLPHLPAVMADLVRFMLTTAVRPDEARRLRMADVEQVEAGVWCWTLKDHKTAHHGLTRQIPLGRAAMAIVHRWAAGKPATAPVFARSDRAVANDDVISIRRWRLACEEFQVADIRKAIQRAAVAGKQPKWTTYQLRHTALREVRLAHGIEAEKALAGWTTTKLADHYAQVAFEEGVALVRKIG